MSEQPKCSQCGAPLAADAPGGQCLRCLWVLGLTGLGPEEADAVAASGPETSGFPGYQVLEQIGEGGCGVVYRAWQTEPLRREVALKVIKLGMDTRAVIARFAAERQALALMDHPHIARVFDAGVTDQGRPFFVMELVRGERITLDCDERRLSVPQRLELFLQVCHAVQHAHQKGIIHRDLKPSNILIAELDGRRAPKVIDFGVAKVIGRQKLADQTLYTAFDQFVGTPTYMSPEQAGLTGEDIDTRSDIYSLGVLLYELLTGRPPFDPARLRRAAPDEICAIIRAEEPAPPSARLAALAATELQEAAERRQTHGRRLVGELRGDLDWLVMKALEKDRARRYDSATALAEDVARHLHNEPVMARPPSTLYRFQKMVRRNPLACGLALVALAALITGLVVSAWMFLLEKKAREVAELRTYFADMGRAARMASVRVGGLEGAVKLLEAWRRHQPDLRGWEWFYLNGLSHHDVLTIPAESNQVWSVAWSPDGKRLATGGAEGAVKIWDAATGHALASLSGHTGDVLAVAWHPAGRRLASAGRDGTVRLWYLNEKPGLILAEQHLPVNSLGWSPNGQSLAWGGDDGTIQVWDVEDGARIRSFDAGSKVSSVSWSKDGTRLVGCGYFDLLSCWEVRSGRRLWSLPPGLVVGPMTVAYSPDGTQLATGGTDNSVSFRDAGTGTNLISFWDNQNIVLSVAWNPQGTLLASATKGDGRIALRDMRAGGRTVRDFRGHRGAVQSVCWRPDGAQFASASTDGTVKLWAVEQADASTVRLCQPDQVPALAWSPDGTKLATGGRRTRGWIWDRRRLSAPVALVGDFTPWTFAVAWSPSGARLATGGSDGLEIWDPSGPTRLWREAKVSGEIQGLAWSPSGNEIAAVGGKNEVTIWEVATGKRRGAIELARTWPTTTVAWSPGGRSLATGVGDKIYIWDAHSLAETKVLAGHTDGIRGLAWSPDGSRLASASEDTSARIWDVARGKEVGALFGHAAAVYAVAWSPDGRRVATGSYDLSVKIWDPVTGGEVCSFDKPGGIEQMIYALAWSRDGQRLACSDMEGNICILDSAPGFPGKTAAVPPQLPARESRSDTAMIRSLKSYCTAVEPMAANDPDALRRLAWIFAAARYPEVRDGRKALVYAQQASTLTGGKNPVVLSILAAAYAEAGDYTNAVSTQKQALAVLPNVDLRTEYAAALKQFESHQPVRSDSW